MLMGQTWDQSPIVALEMLPIGATNKLAVKIDAKQKLASGSQFLLLTGKATADRVAVSCPLLHSDAFLIR
jgi:hypothetical protein